MSRRRPDGSLDIDDYINALGGDGAQALGYNRPYRRIVPESSPPPPSREVRSDVDAERPYLVGWAPAEASTNTELALIEPMIWDVNRYYRDLGFSWPYTRIGRKELMRAYQELDGPNDVRLTYCFHQLLNEYVRWEYDRIPLGEVFFDDYVAEELRRRAVGEAHRRYVEEGIQTEAEEVFSEWGLESTDEAPESSARERYEAAQAQAARKRLTAARKAADTWWGWSYYVWRAKPMLGENHRLARWQSLLLEEFSKKNARVRFCVGIVGRQPHPWVVGTVGQRTVVFINEDPSLNPTSTMAESAVAFVLSEHVNHSHQ